MKRINPIDGAVGLLAFFLLFQILGYALAIALPWSTEPDIVSVLPAEASPGDTLRLKGRNFDPRAKIKIGDRILDLTAFLTSSIVEVGIPLDFPSGHYPVSVKNKWNKQGRWNEQLVVKRRDLLAESLRLAESNAMFLVQLPDFKKARLPIFRKTPRSRARVPARASLLCFLRVEKVTLESSFKWFMQTLPEGIRVVAVIPEQKSLVAQVMLYSRRNPKPGVTTYCLDGSQRIKKGFSFCMANNNWFRVYGVALEDPVPLKQADG